MEPIFSCPPTAALLRSAFVDTRGRARGGHAAQPPAESGCVLPPLLPPPPLPPPLLPPLSPRLLPSPLPPPPPRPTPSLLLFSSARA